MADVRDASDSERPCGTSSRDERRSKRLTMGFTGPSVVRLEAEGNVPATVRSRVALVTVIDRR